MKNGHWNRFLVAMSGAHNCLCAVERKLANRS